MSLKDILDVWNKDIPNYAINNIWITLSKIIKYKNLPNDKKTDYSRNRILTAHYMYIPKYNQEQKEQKLTFWQKIHRIGRVYEY